MLPVTASAILDYSKLNAITPHSESHSSRTELGACLRPKIIHVSLSLVTTDDDSNNTHQPITE